MPVPLLITPDSLRFLQHEQATFAVIDVREEGEYNGAHITGSICVPRRLLEVRAPQIFPHKGIQIIVCDDDGGRAQRAGVTLGEMGYQRVAVLWGGVNRWFSEDYPVEWGINVSSKDFGERVEVRDHVPTWNALELSRRLAAGEKLQIFDTRTPQEFSRFSIPGAECIPNVEIARWAHDLKQESSGATLVVNCGGRTRSIIGARTLMRMGLDNVVSLKNGTSGWALAGLGVELGNQRVRKGMPSDASLRFAEDFSRRVAQEDGVELIGLPALKTLRKRTKTTTTYQIDVRSREEYLDGHIPGFTWFPGGQTIQRSDDVAPIRSAPIVFCCDRLSRAAITGGYFKQLGFPRVMALDGGLEAWIADGQEVERGDPYERPATFGELTKKLRHLTARQLRDMLASGDKPRLFFVGTSREFAEGHVPGAAWVSRSRLDLVIAKQIADKKAVVVIADNDGISAVMAAGDIARLGFSNVAVFDRGMKDWTDAGYELERGLTGVMASPEDILPTIPNRSFENMMNYLSWEEALGRKYTAPENADG